LGFIRYALQFENPPFAPHYPTVIDPQTQKTTQVKELHQMTRLEVVEEAEHPPGYWISVLAVSYPVRAIMGGTTCDSLAMSTQVTSVLAALLLTFPMFYLGRIIFDRQTAFVATLLFQVLPVWSAITSDGLSDGLFLLMSTTTLWLGARAFREPTPFRFGLTGMSAGFAYLVRPEGVLLAGAVGCTAVACILLRRWNWRSGTARIAGLVAGSLLIGLPYVCLIGKLTNKPTGRQFTGEEVVAYHESITSAAPVATPLFGVWWSQIHSNGDSKVVWAAKQVPLQIMKTLHYSLPFMSIFGFYLFRRKIWEDNATLYLGVQLAIYLAVLFMLALMAGYISERHTLVVSLIGSYFAAATIPKWGEWLAQIPFIGRIWSPQFLSAALVFWLLVFSVPADFKRLHSNRAGHRAAGEWLAQNMSPDEEILDVFAWAAFYAHRDWNLLHDNFAFVEKKAPVYVIWEPRLPHSRLTSILDAKRYGPDMGKPVFCWPAGDLEKANVIVYRFVP
jgi:hypothetical protein